jgi:coenzyme F420-0:L-glutamate ligase/coenzyme F420-1:gamma-L-glutamate ligase
VIAGDSLLALLHARRTIREFAPRAVERAQLERLVAAALTAPSATNRQPWQFTIVTAAAARARIVAAVRAATERIDAVIRAGAHADEWGRYGDFFWQPLASAAAIVVPCVREPPDALAGFLRSGGADPARFELPSAMHAERCALGGAVLALALQAHADGLGAAWMAGPMVARSEVEALCGIERPWQMAGAIAVGYPVVAPPAPTKKSLADAIRWIEEIP